jgi:hypothetical protein
VIRVLTQREANELIASVFEPKPVSVPTYCASEGYSLYKWSPLRKWCFNTHSLEWFSGHRYTEDIDSAFLLGNWLIGNGTQRQIVDFTIHLQRISLMFQAECRVSDIMAYIQTPPLLRCRAFIFAMTGEEVEIQGDDEDASTHTSTTE